MVPITLVSSRNVFSLEVGVSQTVQVVAGLHERGIGTGHAVCREGIAESCEGFKSCTPAAAISIVKAAWVQ